MKYAWFTSVAVYGLVQWSAASKMEKTRKKTSIHMRMTGCKLNRVTQSPEYFHTKRTMYLYVLLCFGEVVPSIDVCD